MNNAVASVHTTPHQPAPISSTRRGKPASPTSNPKDGPSMYRFPRQSRPGLITTSGTTTPGWATRLPTLSGLQPPTEASRTSLGTTTASGHAGHPAGRYLGHTGFRPLASSQSVHKRTARHANVVDHSTTTVGPGSQSESATAAGHQSTHCRKREGPGQTPTRPRHRRSSWAHTLHTHRAVAAKLDGGSTANFPWPQEGDTRFEAAKFFSDPHVSSIPRR
ncbi:MAG: hypothetical protein CM1200mP2_52740 [Planctomycetaceae bacterium]|nr:MAG: hypothetical protein CM1200mP2_52740 [Planctomycetaceae bacterium]